MGRARDQYTVYSFCSPFKEGLEGHIAFCDFILLMGDLFKFSEVFKKDTKGICKLDMGT